MHLSIKTPAMQSASNAATIYPNFQSTKLGKTPPRDKSIVPLAVHKSVVQRFHLFIDNDKPRGDRQRWMGAVAEREGMATM